MDKALLLRLYRDMLEIRRFEEVAQRCYAEGLISGFLHLYIGQEGVAAGAISAAEPTDYIVATYREHGHYLARTHDLRGAMAELFGRETGCSKGRGGSMHLFNAAHRFLGGHAIVGGHVPLAAGVAFASKYRSEKDVTLCFFGDGSANMGAFHEGLCLASLWKLPVVFLCENNLYAMGTPLYKTLAGRIVSTRALGYPMARETVNGDDGWRCARWSASPSGARGRRACPPWSRRRPTGSAATPSAIRPSTGRRRSSSSGSSAIRLLRSARGSTTSEWPPRRCSRTSTPRCGGRWRTR
jgi:TPP-dependent pyruvate/acetoin dehydrogenase alpha subunit